MNLSQIQQFLTIVKYMNLSKAATELYVSQPALSLALGRLEKELGVRLFFRDGNKLILSHDGEALYDYFKDLNEAHQRLVSKTEELARPSTQEEYITFGFSGSPLQFAALSITGICDNFKGKHVKIVSADPDLLKELLLTRQLDFALTYAPLESEKLERFPISREEIAVAVSKKHPLAKRDSKTITLAELAEETLVLQAKDQHLRAILDNIFAQYNFVPKKCKEYSYSRYKEEIIHQKRNDDFVALLPVSSYTATWAEDCELLHISDCNFERITSLSWLRERKLQYQYRDFINYIAKHYDDHRSMHGKLSETYQMSLL